LHRFQRHGVASQSTGKIIIGGALSQIGIVSHNRNARLERYGSKK